MAKTRIERIEQYLKEQTRLLIQNGQVEQVGIDALNCALDLNLDRANVSKDLNKLWKEGKVIKIQGKPVYYLDYNVLNQYFPDHFFPSVISKNEKFYNYLNKTNTSEASLTSTDEEIDPLDSLIGASGSLSEILVNAKSAIAYPPHGIYCMIHGNAGVGKTLLANRMVKYACQIKNLEKIPFLTLHCQNYQDNPSLFTDTLLGSSKKTIGKTSQGALNQCENGILLLEQIEFLPFSCQNLLSTIMTQKKYIPLHQQDDQPLRTMIIATTEKHENDLAIRSLSQIIPIHLHLQDIDNRGIYEKIEFILDLFTEEAVHTGTTIRVHKDIIALFAAKRFPNNIVQMRNEIQISCSKAYLQTANPKMKTVYITYQSLSLEMLSQSENTQALTSSILRLLSCIPTDYLQFDSNGTSTAATIFKNAPTAFDEHRLRQFVDEFNINVNDLDDIDNYVRENISVLKDCPNPQLEAIKRNINPFVYQITLQKIMEREQFVNLKNNPKLLYGILLHISNYLTRIEHEKSIPTEKQKSVTEQIYHDEYLCAKEIYQTFGNIYNITPSEREIDFLASYLAISNQWINHVNIAILLICHGDSIATQMVDYVHRVVEGTYYVDCINYTSSIQLNDCLELACLKVAELNRGAGVLIVCDMEPLTSIGEYVYRQTRIPTRTISGITLPGFIRIVEQSTSSFNNLDTIRIEHVQKEEPTQETKVTSSTFLDQIRDRIIAKTVSFIDTHKAVSILNTCLQETLKELEIPYTVVIAIKYLCHCTNMLERVIKNEPWDFQKLNIFMQQNYHIMHVIEHKLEYAADSFGIKIPSSEIAYVAQIFLLEV